LRDRQRARGLPIGLSRSPRPLVRLRPPTPRARGCLLRRVRTRTLKGFDGPGSGREPPLLLIVSGHLTSPGGNMASSIQSRSLAKRRPFGNSPPPGKRPKAFFKTVRSGRADAAEARPIRQELRLLLAAGCCCHAVALQAATHQGQHPDPGPLPTPPATLALARRGSPQQARGSGPTPPRPHPRDNSAEPPAPAAVWLIQRQARCTPLSAVVLRAPLAANAVPWAWQQQPSANGPKAECTRQSEPGDGAGPS